MWKEEKIKHLLTEPVGSPIHLTMEEAAAITKDAFGSKPDQPTGKQYVHQIRPIWRGLLRK